MATLRIASATAWAEPLSHTLSFNMINTGDTDLEFISSNPAILFNLVEV